MKSLKRTTCALALVAACDSSPSADEPDARVPADASVMAPADASVMTDSEAPTSPVPGGGLGGGALSGSLDVHVVSARDGQPIAGAAITVGTQALSADRQGHARLSGLTGSAVQVSATAEGFVPSTWVGVGAAQVTLPLAPVDDTVTPSARARVRIQGLSALPARDDGATYQLRLLASLSPDLQALDAERLMGAPAGSTCDFAPGEVDACTVEADARVGRQLLYGVVQAVGAQGEPLEPAALFASGELDLVAGLNELPSPLSLLATASVFAVDVQRVLPPVDGAKVVGVPGLKVAGGVLVFPPSERVLLPRTGGALGEGSYWYISEATYDDAAGDALRVLVARRGLSGEDELAPDPWPEVSARPVRKDGALTFASIEGGVRQVRVRDQQGAKRLDVVMLGGATQLALPEGLATVSLQVQSVETFAPFDPLAFALPEVLAETLQRVERVSVLPVE